MDTKLTHQTVIKEVLSTYARYKPVYGDIDSRLTFDDEHGSYALLQVGWAGDEYVHGAVIHIDLIGENLFTDSLRQVGVIVKFEGLGFRHQVCSFLKVFNFPLEFMF